MRIFEKDGKVNFVDDFNVLVGYDMRQNCCEHAIWKFTDTPVTKPNTKYLYGKAPINLDKYRFDPKFFYKGHPESDYETRIAVFRLTPSDTSLPIMYLTLENTHNGYYAHGFTVEMGGLEILADSL